MLAPSLRPGELTVIQDLSNHKGEAVRRHLERVGVRFKFLPPYSLNLNSIELAFSKLKQLWRLLAARTADAPSYATRALLDRVTASDATECFRQRYEQIEAALMWDHERLPPPAACLHYAAFACLTLAQPTLLFIRVQNTP